MTRGSSDWLDEDFRRGLNWERTPGARYPFVDMSKSMLDVLAVIPPERGEELRLPAAWQAWAEGGKVHTATRNALHAVSRWLHGPRKIIDISRYSLETLVEIRPRFQDLPTVSDEEPWRRGAIFCIPWVRTGHRGKVSPNGEVQVYMEPLCEEPGVRYTIWCRDLQGFLCEVSDPRQAQTYTALDHSLGIKRTLGVINDAYGTRVPIGEFLTVCINAMAAMADTPTIVHNTRNAPRKRNTRIGPVNRVRRLTLGLGGLNLVTRRWTTLPMPEPTEKIEHKDRKSPCEHPVDAHYWRPWVNAPKVDETVLETRQRTRIRKGKPETYTQYRVKRWRTGCQRGEGIRPKLSRIVTGPGDLEVGV